MKLLTAIIVLMSVSFPGPGQFAVASDCVNFAQLPREVGGIDDSLVIRCLATDGDNFCYATFDAPGGSGLRLVWGVAALGAAPTVTGEFVSVLGRPTALACDGALVAVSYGAGSSGGWLLVDFSSPTLPVLRSQGVTADSVVDLELAGGLLCLATDSGFGLLDVANPDVPQDLGSPSDATRARAVEESGGVWFLSGTVCLVSGPPCATFLWAYDFSVPTTPAVLDEITSELGYDYGEEFLSLSARDGTLAVRVESYSRDYLGAYVYQHSLRILDVSSPASMTSAAGFNYGGAVTAPPAVGFGMVYSPVGTTLRYVGNPGGSWSNLYQLGTSSTLVVSADGNHVLGADGTHLAEYSQQMTEATPLQGEVTPWPLSYTVGVQITGNHAFVASEYVDDHETPYPSIGIYDLTDPVNPAFVNRVYPPGPGDVTGFMARGDYVYSSFGTYYWPTGSPAAANVQIYKGGCVVGDVLYAVESQGFRAYDITTPGTPVAAGDYLASLPLGTLVANGTTLYAFGSDLSVFDVSDPLVPELLSTLSAPPGVTGGEVADGMLYLSGGDGLTICDLADPVQPVVVGHLVLGSCADVQVASGTAYVAAQVDGLAVVDVSNPTAPVRLGGYSPGGDATGVSLYANKVYYLNSEKLSILGGECSALSGVRRSEIPGATALSLARPYPNPFNPTTELHFEMAQAGHATMSVHDISGRLVRTLIDATLAEGPHDISWDGRDGAGRMMPAGVYFAHLRSANVAATRKLVLVK